MDDIMVMHVLHSMADLLDIFPHLLFTKTYLFFEGGIQITPATVFHHQIDVCVVVETGIESDYVRMLQETLNLDLPDQLVYELCSTSENGFGYFFDGTNKVCSDVSA